MAPNSKQLDKASGSRLDQIVSKKPVTDDERKEMRRIFEAFDRDGSDSISADELDNILQLLNVRLEKKDLHRLTNCIDANGDGQVTFDEFVKFLSIRVLEPARNIKIIDTKHTIASRLVGGNSKLESWIFYTVVKQRGVCGKLLWIFWYSGLILGLFSQQTVVLGEWWKYFSACGLLMLPLPCFAFLVLCMDLIKELLWQPEFWCILILQLGWATVSIRLMADERCVFWICLTPSICVSALSDAYPAKFRSHFQKMFFGGLMLSMIWWCLMITYAWNEPINDVRWNYERLRGHASTGSVANVATAILFAMRNLWSAFASPDVFVIIVAPVQTTHVRLEDVLKDHQDIEEGARVTLSAAGVPRITLSKDSSGSSPKGSSPKNRVDPSMRSVKFVDSGKQISAAVSNAYSAAYTDVSPPNDVFESLQMENMEMKKELRLLKEQLLILSSQERERTPWKTFRRESRLIQLPPCPQICPQIF